MSEYTQAIKKNFIPLIIGLVVLALLGFATLRMFSKLDMITSNTTAQRLYTKQQLDNSVKQLHVAEAQLKIAQQQLDTAKQQLEISKQTLDTAEQTRDISQAALAEVRAMHTILEQSLAIQQRTLEVAQATLQEVKDLNQKTPNTLQLLP